MRIFLDANVLFSAAKSDGAVRRLLALVSAAGHECWADGYVVEEARRNLVAKAPEGVPALSALLARVRLAAAQPHPGAAEGTAALPEKDRPVLAAAKIPVELPRHSLPQHNLPQHSGSDPIVDLPLDKYIPIAAPSRWMEDCGLDLRMTCVSMGNPHVVIFCQDVASVPLTTIGPVIERQPIFPKRINVHFVQVHSPDEVTMRTWERGSGITLACGTGASAVCVAGALTGRTSRRILAHLPGGDLELEWAENDSANRTRDHVYMTGPAVEVFSGEWTPAAVMASKV